MIYIKIYEVYVKTNQSFCKIYTNQKQPIFYRKVVKTVCKNNLVAQSTKQINKLKRVRDF